MACPGVQGPPSADERVTRYMGLVRAVVQRLAANLPPHVSREDLEGYGVVGLLEALQRYDPSQGVRFETFAWHRIRGAILDHLRSLDLAARSDRKTARRIERAHERLAAQLGREPSREELAAEVGLEPEVLDAELARLHTLVVTSFEELVARAAGPEPATDSGGPEEAAERGELLEALRRGLQRLSERERLVLGLYYYEGLTLAEIGAILDLTESRVCQIQATALLRLRTFLAQQGFVARP
ncbi:MAG: FliA/WhiG family RNA polymerase sigma factor [Armatimonadota bacterium]|nr:FliA/WhiG family RNA polymerase sigma factor [Armatimonadota bacterium]MDW8155931.1 FliA/WhiG family RNA polymerase sigma factor [Armatimonadota bacterium]